MDNQQQIVNVVKHTTDLAAFGTVLATIAGWLPSVAALFSILWLGVQIWESKTATGFRERRKRRKK